jgi:Galactose oxidase, central domain/Kelch motif
LRSDAGGVRAFSSSVHSRAGKALLRRSPGESYGERSIVRGSLSLFTKASVAVLAIVGALAAQGCISQDSSAPPSSDAAYSDQGSNIQAASINAPAAGDVLIAGGAGRLDQSLAAAEFYDPGQGKFLPTGPMTDGRAGDAAAAIVGDKVLLAGGFSGTAAINNYSLTLSGGVLTSADLFDEGSGKFSPTAPMNAARMGFTATTLANGQVLIAGGLDNHGNILDSAELYDPASGKFSDIVTSMSDRRAFHTATLLVSGKVLIAGGVTDLSGDTTNSADLYDPASNTITQASSMDHARAGQTATLFSVGSLAGDVLIAGGGGGAGFFLKDSSAEIYDASSGQFLLLSSFMNEARVLQSATELPDGRVLLAGGFDGSVAMSAGALSGASGEISNSAEIFDPSEMQFVCVGGFNSSATKCNPSMNFARAGQSATLFASGKLAGEVLITGGFGGVNPASMGRPLNTAEIFDPKTLTFRATGSMNRARALQTATLLL